MTEEEIQGTGAYDIIVRSEPEPHIELSTADRQVRAFLDARGLGLLRDSILEMCVELNID